MGPALRAETRSRKFTPARSRVAAQSARHAAVFGRAGEDQHPALGQQVDHGGRGRFEGIASGSGRAQAGGMQ